MNKQDNMYIIADAGSTKIDWRLIFEDGAVKGITTPGVNPVLMTEDEITEAFLSKADRFAAAKDAANVYFYGAGILSEEVKAKMCRSLKRLFPKAECFAASDMLAAARALCGRRPGIACILGTGSNCCLFDGENIGDNVPAGGFILGDEAGGAYFGKRLVSDYIKGLLPAAIEQEFRKRYNLDYPTVVQKVYKEQMPSRWLASFSEFIYEFRHHPYIVKMLSNGFDEFLRRNVMRYDTQKYAVNFTGSVAFYYKDILEKSLASFGMKPGRIVRTPMDGLIAYHKSH